jgi:hypothetical protein
MMLRRILAPALVLLTVAPASAQSVRADRVITPLLYANITKSLTLGGTGIEGCITNPPTTANCEAVSVRLASAFLEQRLITDSTFRTQWFVGTDGGHVRAYNGGGWMPLKLDGGPVQVGGGGLHVGTSDIIDPGAGNTALDGYVGLPGYVSQTTGWRVDNAGGADFRYIFTDELHAKKFIADLEQALAGGQIIAKSVAQIGAIFTAPAPGSISTLTVKDLPSAAGMAVFEAGDYLRIRTFSRSGGSLSITDAWGTVASYTDLDGGLQSWQFTRLITNGGAMTTGTEIEIDSIVLDYGISGNGFYEVSAVDGVYGINSPYAQIVTWAGNSPIAANQTLRARLGNLRGITGTTGEYGLIAGTYAGTGGTYFRASNQAFELHGIDLKLWNGTTNVLRLDHTTPYWSMGNPAPTTYSSGTGCWSGMDAGAYKWRCGNPAGQIIDWNGTTLTIVGDVQIVGELPDAANSAKLGGVAASVFIAAKDRVNLGLDASGNPAIPAVAAPSGNGLYLSSDHVGYYGSGAWKTYMDNAGNFYLGGTGGNLTWVSATNTLTISATLSGSGAGITAISGGNITTDSITATQIAASAITTSELAANSVTSAAIVAGTIVASDIAAGAITAYEIAAVTITGANIAAGTITASKIAANTLTAAVIDSGAIGTDELYAQAVTADKIAADTITAGQIAASAITTSELAALAVTADKIAADTITAGQIAANAITTSELAASSVTADKLSVSTLSAISANIGTVTAGSISGVSLRLDAGALGVSCSGSFPTSCKFFVADTGLVVAEDLEAGDLYVYNDLRLTDSDSQVYINNPSTTDSADYPLVWSSGNGWVYRKTDGVNTTICGGGVAGLTIERGIVTDYTCAAPELTPAALLARIEQLEAQLAALRIEGRR